MESTDSTAPSTRYNLNVIGDKAAQTLGGCPLCFGTVLYLSEKKVSFTVARYLDSEDLSTDPHLQQLSKESGVAPPMPVLHDQVTDKWSVGVADVIAAVDAEEPMARPMGVPQSNIASDFMPTIQLGTLSPDMSHDVLYHALQTIFATPKQPETPAWVELMHTLTQLNELLAHHQHAVAGSATDVQVFLNGDRTSPSADDCFLAARLAHIEVALREFRNWDMYTDPKLPALAAYMKQWSARPSWRAARFNPDIVVQQFKAKMDKQHASNAGWLKFRHLQEQQPLTPTGKVKELFNAATEAMERVLGNEE
ncbi:Glutathione S-transferase dhar1, mitochondrial [Sorochytrium milnesiophthora]